MQRLATVWLICVVVGFLLAAGAAFVLSLALDHGGAPDGRPAPVAGASSVKPVRS